MKVINLRRKGCIAIGLQPTAATVNMRAETRMQATVTDVIHMHIMRIMQLSKLHAIVRQHACISIFLSPFCVKKEYLCFYFILGLHGITSTTLYRTQC